MASSPLPVLLVEASYGVVDASKMSSSHGLFSATVVFAVRFLRLLLQQCQMPNKLYTSFKICPVLVDKY